jgi:hypothetical protein
MNLTLAKIKKRRIQEGRNPFDKTVLPPAYLQTRHDYLSNAIRLETLRKGNFHVVRDYERQLELSDKRKRYQALQTHESEYNRLRSASQHGLLQARAQERMEDLKNLLGV